MSEEMRAWLSGRLPTCNCELPKTGEITMPRPAMIFTEAETFTCPWCEIELKPEAANAKLADMSQATLSSVTVKARLHLVDLRKKKQLSEL